MMSPNASLHKEDKLLFPDHHLIWNAKSGFRPVQSNHDERRHEELRLERPQQEEGEKLIYQTLADSDRNQMEQRVTPNDVSLVTCYQTVTTNPKDKGTDKKSSLESQWGWDKVVSFLTNATNRLHLSSTFYSLAQTPVVADSGKVRELNINESNNLDNKNLISESTTNFTFFL